MIYKNVVTYQGSKLKHLDFIYQYFPKHKVYVEPFLGSGNVFFNKKPSKYETINDLDEYVYNFFRVYREDFEKLNHAIQNTMYCEKDFNETRKVLNDKDLCPIEKARIFFLRQNASLYGRYKEHCLRLKINTKVELKTKKLNFELLKDRLKNVQITNRDALKLIKNVDTEDTFFYIDPPYPEASQKYKHKFSMEDFNNLIKLLKEIKGKFMLSFYKKEGMSLPKEWVYKSKDIVTTIQADDKVRKEWIAMNYEIEEDQLSLI